MSAIERLFAAWHEPFPADHVAGECDAVRIMTGNDPDLSQDIADGEALRRLWEVIRDVPTMAGDAYINLTFSSEFGVICHCPGVGFHPGSPTIAAAADKAREALR